MDADASRMLARASTHGARSMLDATRYGALHRAPRCTVIREGGWRVRITRCGTTRAEGRGSERGRRRGSGEQPALAPSMARALPALSSSPLAPLSLSSSSSCWLAVYCLSCFCFFLVPSGREPTTKFSGKTALVETSSLAINAPPEHQHIIQVPACGSF